METSPRPQTQRRLPPAGSTGHSFCSLHPEHQPKAAKSTSPASSVGQIFFCMDGKTFCPRMVLLHPATPRSCWVWNTWWLSSCSGKVSFLYAFLFTLEQNSVSDCSERAGSIGLSPPVTNPTVRQHITCLAAQRWPKNGFMNYFHEV